MKKFLTRREVAVEYPVSFSHLAHLACANRGPSYAILGKKAIYEREEVEEWLKSKFNKPVNCNTPPRKRGRPKKTEAKSPQTKGRDHG